MAFGVRQCDGEGDLALAVPLDRQGPDGEQGVRQALGRALKDAVVRRAGEGVAGHGVGAGAHGDGGGREGEAIASVLVGGRQVRGAALAVQVQRRAGVGGGSVVGGSVVGGSRGVGVGQEGVARAGHNALRIGRCLRDRGIGDAQHALHTDGKHKGQLAGEALAAGGGVSGGDHGAVLALTGGGEGDRGRTVGIGNGKRGREDPVAVLGRDCPFDIQCAAAAVAGGER